MTPQEACLALAELCEKRSILRQDANETLSESVTVKQIRAILADVQTEEGITLTAEEAFFTAGVFWAHLADADLSDRTVERMKVLAERLGGEA